MRKRDSFRIRVRANGWSVAEHVCSLRFLYCQSRLFVTTKPEQLWKNWEAAGWIRRRRGPLCGKGHDPEAVPFQSYPRSSGLLLECHDLGVRALAGQSDVLTALAIARWRNDVEDDLTLIAVRDDSPAARGDGKGGSAVGIGGSTGADAVIHPGQRSSRSKCRHIDVFAYARGYRIQSAAIKVAGYRGGGEIAARLRLQDTEISLVRRGDESGILAGEVEDRRVIYT